MIPSYKNHTDQINCPACGKDIHKGEEYELFRELEGECEEYECGHCCFMFNISKRAHFTYSTYPVEIRSNQNERNT